jgi:hypothetical protein
MRDLSTRGDAKVRETTNAYADTVDGINTYVSKIIRAAGTECAQNVPSQCHDWQRAIALAESPAEVKNITLGRAPTVRRRGLRRRYQ